MRETEKNREELSLSLLVVVNFVGVCSLSLSLLSEEKLYTDIVLRENYILLIEKEKMMECQWMMWC